MIPTPGIVSEVQPRQRQSPPPLPNAPQMPQANSKAGSAYMRPGTADGPARKHMNPAVAGSRPKGGSAKAPRFMQLTPVARARQKHSDRAPSYPYEGILWHTARAVILSTQAGKPDTSSSRCSRNSWQRAPSNSARLPTTPFLVFLLAGQLACPFACSSVCFRAC